MLTTDKIPSPSIPAIVQDNQQWLELWLHGKSLNTQAGYCLDAQQFLSFIENKALQNVTLNDLQGSSQFLIEQNYQPTTQQRRINAVKSLLTFGCELGMITVNIGRFIKPPKLKNTLAARILSESQVLEMIYQTPQLRDQTFIRLLYATGARVSEICNLHWFDVREGIGGNGQVTIFGKGGQTRVIIFSAATWEQLQQLKGKAQETAPVFLSRNGSCLGRGQAGRIVKAAAKRVGITESVSPHWLRHSHASHALERGAPIQLVQATLGHASLTTTSRYLHVRPQDSSALRLAV